MYSSAKESLNRMRRLLDAQETLDKLAVELAYSSINFLARTFFQRREYNLKN
jgi:hypothetical protein